MVRTTPIDKLKLSSLTTQSNDSESLDDSDGTGATTLSCPGRRTMVLVKLRVWDPARRSRGRTKVMAATHVVLPHQGELDEAAERLAAADAGNVDAAVRDSRRAALEDGTAGSSSRDGGRSA